VAVAAIQALGRVGDKAAIRRLAMLVEGSELELGPDAAQALAFAGSPEAEAVLIAALGSGDEGARFAAVEALGQSGRVPALRALRVLSKRPAIGDSLRTTARLSIERIQHRLGRTPKGQVSIVDKGEGHVSLTDDVGRVSYTNEDEPAD
jgi:hypothetical protein